MATPSKKPEPSRSQDPEILKVSENLDPNIPVSPALSSQKQKKSPAIRSAQSKKAADKTPGRIAAPPPQQERARKFIVARKSARCGFDFDKCRKEAYDALRASQEEFFRRKPSSPAHGVAVPATGEAFGLIDGATKHGSSGTDEVLDLGVQYPEAGSEARKMKSLEIKELTSSMPEPGSGRVKNLVDAFESLLSISKDDETEKPESNNLNGSNWALSGLQRQGKNAEVDASSVSVFSSAEFFPSRELANDLGLYNSIDGNSERLSWGNRKSGGGGRNKRNSSESLRSWNKMLKVTSQQPFKLRTELIAAIMYSRRDVECTSVEQHLLQRGRIKEEQFIKKVKEMLAEEEKHRIPIAQGLPWTTDEPEHLVKPPVKQSTEPIDIVLHSDVRAVERAEFDQFVVERINFAEKLRHEREMQQKLEEEEEIRRLRRELVPKAQPMPYFDQPFVPKKSNKPQTIPKEPKFHMRPRKPSCSSASIF